MYARKPSAGSPENLRPKNWKLGETSDPNQTKSSHPSIFWMVTWVRFWFRVKFCDFFPIPDREIDGVDRLFGSSFWALQTTNSAVKLGISCYYNMNRMGWYDTIRKIHPSSSWNERHMNLFRTCLLFFGGGSIYPKGQRKKWDFLTLQLPPHTTASQVKVAQTTF